MPLKIVPYLPQPSTTAAEPAATVTAGSGGAAAAAISSGVAAAAASAGPAVTEADADLTTDLRNGFRGDKEAPGIDIDRVVAELIDPYLATVKVGLSRSQVREKKSELLATYAGQRFAKANWKDAISKLPNLGPAVSALAKAR